MTFAAGLRATLRQDPDVILVGEIRDSETASVAAQAALTGLSGVFFAARQWVRGRRGAAARPWAG